MTELMVRLWAAYAADREGRACYRRLECALADHRGPPDGVSVAAVAGRYGATRGRTSRRILERRSI